MGQIGNHPYADTSEPIAEDATSEGGHSFANTDNQNNPCNGTDSCTEGGQDK